MIEQIKANEIELVAGGCVAEPGEPDPNIGSVVISVLRATSPGRVLTGQDITDDN